jgi:hypothetical protein
VSGNPQGGLRLGRAGPGIGTGPATSLFACSVAATGVRLERAGRSRAVLLLLLLLLLLSFFVCVCGREFRPQQQLQQQLQQAAKRRSGSAGSRQALGRGEAPGSVADEARIGEPRRPWRQQQQA